MRVMQPGVVVDEKYEINRRLGTGGCGSVYEARQIDNNRKVAVKVLNPEMVKWGDGAKRFEREAKAIKALEHKNIVDFYGFGVWEKAPYLVVELIEGKSLDDILKSGERMDPARSLRLMRQVFEALAAAHKVGVVHRDMKPSNVMITTDGAGNEVAKLIDFGLAKLLPYCDLTTVHKLTETGMALGTCAYMAPEQVRGKGMDHRVDIYSTGCIWYQMIAGDLPFTATTNFEYMHAHVRDNPKPLDGLPPDYEVLNTVIRNCMMKDPKDRYQHCTSVIADIDAILQGTPKKVVKLKDTGAMAAIAAQKAARQPSFSAKHAAIAGGAVALLLIAGGTIYMQQEKEKETKALAQMEAMQQLAQKKKITKEEADKLLALWNDGGSKKVGSGTAISVLMTLMRHEDYFEDPVKFQLGHELFETMTAAGMDNHTNPQLYEQAELFDGAYRAMQTKEFPMTPQERMQAFRNLEEYYAKAAPRMTYVKEGPQDNKFYVKSLNALSYAIKVRFENPIARKEPPAKMLLSPVNTLHGENAVQHFCEELLLEQTDDNEILNSLRVRLAECYRLQGRLTDAIQLYTIAAKEGSADVQPEAKVSLANLLAVKGELKAAKAVIDSLPDPDNELVEYKYTALARIAFLEKDYAAAYDYATKAEAYAGGKYIRQSPRLIRIAALQAMHKDAQAKQLLDQFRKGHRAISKHDMVNFDAQWVKDLDRSVLFAGIRTP
jgi:hypothetical protein